MKRSPQRKLNCRYVHVVLHFVVLAFHNGSSLVGVIPTVGRIGRVQARDELAQLTQVLVGEQQVLGRGLHVAEGPQQAAPR